LQPFLPPEGSALLRVGSGYQVELDLSQFPSQQLFWFGSWEPRSALVLASHLEPGAIAVDVGANIGILTLAMCDAVIPNGHVHAFEPDPSNFALLRTNVEANKLSAVTMLHQVALTDALGSVTLRRPNDGSFTHVSSAGDSSTTTGIEVKACTLDSYLPIFSRLDLIKIDVEGHEPAVLRGAEETIRRFRPVMVIECAAAHLRREGATPRQIVETAERLGYSVFTASSGHPVNAASGRLPWNDNIVCLPRTLDSP